MQDFVFVNPTKIIFGKDRIKMIGPEVLKFGKKALLVYGRESIKKNGIYDQVATSLQSAGVSFVEFSGVKSNPVLSHAVKGIELARRENVDVILAVGGGSVIDSAKVIAAGIKANHDVWDFFMRRQSIKDVLPLLVVVTVSASASEMNSVAVITNEDGNRKFSIQSPLIQPKTSIMDPSVLFTLSPAYSAYSAVDVLSHMVEGYFNNAEPYSPLQDRLVEGLTKTVMESMNVIMRNPVDYTARANMMWSATLAFNGLISAGMGQTYFPAHMIEHSLSALYDIPHGAGLSIVLPGWMAYAAEKNPERFAHFTREIFEMKMTDDDWTAPKGIAQLKNWFLSIGCPTSLKEGGIPESDIGRIAENACVLAQAWGMKDYSEDVITDILKLCQ